MYPYVAPHTAKIHTLITLGIRHRAKALVFQLGKHRPCGFDSHRPLHFCLVCPCLVLGRDLYRLALTVSARLRFTWPALSIENRIVLDNEPVAEPEVSHQFEAELMLRGVARGREAHGGLVAIDYDGNDIVANVGKRLEHGAVRTRYVNAHSRLAEVRRRELRVGSIELLKGHHVVSVECRKEMLDSNTGRGRERCGGG